MTAKLGNQLNTTTTRLRSVGGRRRVSGGGAGDTRDADAAAGAHVGRGGGREEEEEEEGGQGFQEINNSYRSPGSTGEASPQTSLRTGTTLLGELFSDTSSPWWQWFTKSLRRSDSDKVCSWFVSTKVSRRQQDKVVVDIDHRHVEGRHFVDTEGLVPCWVQLLDLQLPLHPLHCVEGCCLVLLPHQQACLREETCSIKPLESFILNLLTALAERKRKDAITYHRDVKLAEGLAVQQLDLDLLPSRTGESPLPWVLGLRFLFVQGERAAFCRLTDDQWGRAENGSAQGTTGSGATTGAMWLSVGALKLCVVCLLSGSSHVDSVSIG
ncbi:hypothetical protein EYF80_009260 [Liparis tanakae]|uniref:Uncharacterized protein n=1 Tax=Liparis tanakae TaxID=230148 RepID=A0A4Z2IRN9_9TELE|nr:hypothetical protein EYF80_009260 [Liparis tanakae]